MYPTSYILGINKFKDGAWFDPSQEDRIEWALQLLEITENDSAVDIGSGDGRVVIEMARLGAMAVGIEAEIKLVHKAVSIITDYELTDHARILHGDMWEQSYAGYNKVYLYQFKTVMQRLEDKLLAELPLGAKVVSNYWKFPNWKITKKIHDVYLYIKE
jgi:protein-L-isoaspartate O-methyltransferase